MGYFKNRRARINAEKLAEQRRYAKMRTEYVHTDYLEEPVEDVAQDT